MSRNSHDFVADHHGTTIAGFASDFGDGASTSFQIQHDLNTLDITVEVYENSSGATVLPLTTTRDDVGNVTITFGGTVGTDAYRVVIIGIVVT